jgi:hypothetical protein
MTARSSLLLGAPGRGTVEEAGKRVGEAPGG